MADTEFIYDSDDYILAYISGAVLQDGHNTSAGFGVVFNYNHPYNYSGPIIGPFFDNKAEIQAAKWAINKLNDLNIMDKLCLITESKFLLKVVDDWFRRYELFRFWGICVPKEIRCDLTNFHRIASYNSLEEIFFKEMGAHNQNPFKDLAYKLAEDGARQYCVENQNN